MFVNEYMLNMLSKSVLGIPIVAKLGKKEVVKSIYSIPYKTISQYLSNTRGDFIGEKYTVKSPGLARLIEYSEDYNMNDWYSVEAVKVFFNITLEDDIDKNIIAWYNPYMKKISCLTDAYKNPIEKSSSVSKQILEKYLAKNGSDDAYFVDIHSVPNDNGMRYDMNGFFLSKSGIAKRIGYLKKNVRQWSPSYASGIPRSYMDDIENIPSCRFMETVLLACMEKAIYVSYSLSDNGNYNSWTVYDHDMLLEMSHLTRMRIALALFYQNSILAFKALLESCGDVSTNSIGKYILKNHFCNAKGSLEEWGIYTDSFYRILAMCIGYCSSNTAISLIAKNGSFLALSRARAYNANTNAVDALLGPKKAFLASWFSTSFYGNGLPTVPVSGTLPGYNYGGLRKFILDTLKLFYQSPYIVFNGDIVAYYRQGKEFYDYAKQ